MSTHTFTCSATFAEHCDCLICDAHRRGKIAGAIGAREARVADLHGALGALHTAAATLAEGAHHHTLDATIDALTERLHAVQRGET